MADQTMPFMAVSDSRRAAGDRSARAKLVIAVLVLSLFATAAFSLTAGAADVSAAGLFGNWIGVEPGIGLRDRIILYDIRLPRLVLGALIGAGLAVSGAVMQGLFRNPLADPGLIGVSSGAALGAVAVIVLGAGALAPLTEALGRLALPLAAFLGGLAVTSLLYRIATSRGRTSIGTMLLAGIALSALASALMGLLIFVADDTQLRDLAFWQLGSLAGATWGKVGSVAPVILVGLAAGPFMARGLNALALGEATAAHLGVPVQRLKHVAVTLVAAVVGGSVAVSGGIGFVGIVVPHLLRLAIGPDNRYLVPASALLGAILLLAADAVSRTVVAPAELPIGIVTAAAGSPVFLWILLRRRGLVDL